MMDYYKRKLAKHEEYETYARCSGHEQIESSVPEVTAEVGSSEYALVSTFLSIKIFSNVPFRMSSNVNFIILKRL